VLPVLRVAQTLLGDVFAIFVESRAPGVNAAQFKLGEKSIHDRMNYLRTAVSSLAEAQLRGRNDAYAHDLAPRRRGVSSRAAGAARKRRVTQHLLRRTTRP
jgi:hypothetical protein